MNSVFRLHAIEVAGGGDGTSAPVVAFARDLIVLGMPHIRDSVSLTNLSFGLWSILCQPNQKYSQSQKSNDKENLKTPGNSKQDDEEESNEPDYDEDKDQLEEAQEEETGETADATINKVF